MFFLIGPTCLSARRAIAFEWMRLGQCIRRLRYCRCANHRVLEYSNLPLTRRVFLHHQGRPRLDVLFLAIEVPPQIGADKYHRHVRLQEAHLLDLKAVVAAFVDCVKNCAMDVLDVSTAVKELAEDVNQAATSLPVTVGKKGANVPNA